MKKYFFVFSGIVIITFLFLFLWKMYKKSTSSPWKLPTVSYTSECDDDCLENLPVLSQIETSHLRGIKILFRPDVDDELAQLGDCLDSIMNCIDEEGDPGKTFSCVEKSLCPEPCKIAYSKEFNKNMSPEEQLRGIEKVFFEDGSICVPKEREG